MKKIWQSVSFLVLVFFLHISTFCAFEQQQEIKSNFSHKFFVSLFKFFVLQEVRELFPTKTSKIMPIVALLIPLIPLLLKIHRLKKQTFPHIVLEKNNETEVWELQCDGADLSKKSDDINDFLDTVTMLAKKYNERKRKFLKKCNELEIGNKELELDNKQLLLKMSTLISQHNEEQRILKQKKNNLKRMIIAFQTQIHQSLPQEETDKYARFVAKKQGKIETRIDVRTELDVQGKRVKKEVRVENMVDDIIEKHDDGIRYKYTTIPTNSGHCCVFQYSTKASLQFFEYKNYLFIIDQETQNSVTEMIESKQKTLQRVCKEHACSCFSRLRPQDGVLYTFVYHTVSTAHSVDRENAWKFLPESRKEFDLVAWFGKQVTPEMIIPIMKNLRETSETIACLAGISKPTRKWIKKNNIASLFKYCFHLRSNKSSTFLPSPVVNIALEPLLPDEFTYDTVAVASFLRFASLCQKKVYGPREEQLVQYRDYQCAYTKELDYFGYNVDTKTSSHQLTIAIANSIRSFSDNPMEFINTRVFSTLLFNTQIVNSLQNHSKKQLVGQDRQLVFKANIPTEKEMVVMSESIKSLVCHS